MRRESRRVTLRSPQHVEIYTRHYDAVLFDLLSALLDSWSLWNAIAGDAATGRRWRMAYLERTYATGRYRDYLTLVAEAAQRAGLDASLAYDLDARWDALQPWAEAGAVLRAVAAHVPIAVLTNCSEALAERAAARVGVPFNAVVSAERCGWYKPTAAAYRAGIEALGTPPRRTLFVAGSPFDVGGAVHAGMHVYLHDRAGLASAEVRAQAKYAQTSLDALPAALGIV